MVRTVPGVCGTERPRNAFGKLLRNSQKVPNSISDNLLVGRSTRHNGAQDAARRHGPAPIKEGSTNGAHFFSDQAVSSLEKRMTESPHRNRSGPIVSSRLLSRKRHRLQPPQLPLYIAAFVE